jgi:peptide/nickel transport system permease protein
MRLGLLIGAFALAHAGLSASVIGMGTANGGGIGWLLVQSTLNLDFPVVQAVVFVMVVSVFLSNAVTEAVQVLLDPRIRSRARAAS